MDRREALKLMGFTSVALLAGCKKDIMEGLLEEDEQGLEYTRIRGEEDEKVWNLLKSYAQGTDETSNEVYDRLNIAFMTDSHIDMGEDPTESRRNVKDAIEFCNNSLAPISAIIQGGDIVTELKPTNKAHKRQLKDFFELTRQVRMPYLFTKGNHDINSIGRPPSHRMTDEDWGEVWFDKAEEAYGIVRGRNANGVKTGYYYYDLTDWKVRIICVDCFDVDYSQTDSAGDVLYWGGTSFYIANEQFNWIANTALNFDDKEEKDWGVIIFMHHYRPSDTNGTTIEPIFESVFKKFNSMLLSFKKQSTFSLEYSFPQNSFYDLNVNADWTRYSKLEKKPFLICVLSGHLHKDLYLNWWGAVHLVTANQFCGMDFSDERIIRVSGTNTQNLFDILNIDLRERKLRVIRYGASANLDGKSGHRFLPDGQLF